MLVRRMRYRDDEVDQVTECLKQLTRTYPDELKRQYAALARINNGAYYWFVAVEDERIVGTATMWIEEKMGGIAGHIEDVVVDQQYRGRGIGLDLVNECVEAARELGAYKCVLDCDPKLENFYSRAGFYANGITMRIDLDQVDGVPE